MLNFYVLDVETNGLSTEAHEIIEFAVIRVKDKVQYCKNIICEKPQNSSYDALKITGKTLADLKQGFKKELIVEEVNKFFEQDGLTPAHRVIIAHNGSFDRRFIHTLWKKCNSVFPANLWLDTMALAREYGKKQGLKKFSVTLPASCDLMGIKKYSNLHNAKTDSRQTYFLWKELEIKTDYLTKIATIPQAGVVVEENNAAYDDLMADILGD